MNPADLERLITDELRELPALLAPHTLAPRVLAAVQTWSRRPWYSRPWFTWPVAGQLVSLTALSVLGAGGATLLPIAGMSARDATSLVSAGLRSEVTSALAQAVATTNVAQDLWRTLVEPTMPYAFAFVVLMCVACAGLGTALSHVVFGRTLHS